MKGIVYLDMLPEFLIPQLDEDYMYDLWTKMTKKTHSLPARRQESKLQK